jgi:SWI/SNF-related matrix-associated actin-dependent regulator 1 of chromatin subfamily A
MSFTFPNIFNEDNPALLRLFEDRKETDKRTQVELQQLERVRLLLTPFILRRLKSDVLSELVGKETTVKMVPLEEKQRLLYDNILSEWKKKKVSSSKAKVSSSYTNVFTDLRKAANHPLLLNHTFAPHLHLLAKHLYR